MKILCAFGEYNYGKRERGRGYEFSNFLPAFKALGYDVAFFETLDRDRYTDFAHLNRCFLETVQKEKPDVIFCVLMHYELWMETLDIAKAIGGAAVINWATDDSWKYRQFSRLIAPHFDLYATTYAIAVEKAGRDGLDNFYLTQWAAAGATLQEPLPARECRHAVTFVGSRYGNREDWIAGLRQKGIEVECFGHGWPRGSVAGDEIPRIMRESLISLNFGDSGVTMDGLRLSRSRQIKARIFEVPGCGGFLMTQPADDLERYYTPGSEIETFNNLDDLARKIGHYLDHPEDRDRIALAGNARTRAEHTYEIRFSQLLEAANRLRKQETGGEKAVAVSNSVLVSEDFKKLELRHQTNFGLRLLRSLLTIPCCLVWRKQRGPRAARRILFEVSWRLFGHSTYTASGWPGRIFYKES
ncbi:MAG: glycosyltransferase [Smithella sp.]